LQGVFNISVSGDGLKGYSYSEGKWRKSSADSDSRAVEIGSETRIVVQDVKTEDNHLFIIGALPDSKAAKAITRVTTTVLDSTVVPDGKSGMKKKKSSKRSKIETIIKSASEKAKKKRKKSKRRKSKSDAGEKAKKKSRH
jgi:hypothetical protein